MRLFQSSAALALIVLGLAGCARSGDITDTGILTHYTACPPVAIVAPAGDVTLFNPPASRDASAIDVVANITNLRSTCDETGDRIVTSATFEVQALRRDNRGARDVVLPYFATVVQGAGNIVAKRVRNVGLHFDDGSYRANTTGAARLARRPLPMTSARSPAARPARRRRDRPDGRSPVAPPSTRSKC